MSKSKSIILWTIAFVITIAAAVYQKATGPTYPLRGTVTINQTEYKYKLLRSHGGTTAAPIEISVPEGITGILKYRKFRTNDEFVEVPMLFSEDKLVGFLPNQPPAGKLEYFVVLQHNDQFIEVNSSPVVIRFKGDVPAFILIPHIIFMFLAMFVSTRTGIEALFKGTKTYKLALFTLISFVLGGFVLGPFVQKFAFGEYWTGWPYGGDWTDNKTGIGVLGWLIATLVLYFQRNNRIWPIIAMLLLFTIYMIPHSLGGSELDPTTGKVTTGLKK